MHYAEGRLIKESERFRKRYFAMRDRKKRAQAQAAAPPDEGLNIPLNNPSEPSDVIPTGVEESEISPCASLSRDDKKEGGRDDKKEGGRDDKKEGGRDDKKEGGRDDNHAVIPSVVEGPLSNGQQAVLDCIKAHPGLKVPGIEAETGIPSKSIERHIKVLIERNLIEHRGSKKTGGYHAL